MAKIVAFKIHRKSVLVVKRENFISWGKCDLRKITTIKSQSFCAMSERPSQGVLCGRWRN